MQILTILLLSLNCAAWAQPAADEPPPQEGNLEAPAGEQAESQQTSAPAPAARVESKGVSIDDARLNFSTIVESFIIERSPAGYWPLTQKSTGKMLKLKLDKLFPKSIHQVSPGHFTGAVGLREAETGDTMKADFTVDFSGTQWKVESMNLRKPKAPAKAAQGKESEKKPETKAKVPSKEKPVDDNL